MNLHQNKPPTWLVHIPGPLWVLGLATGTWTHKTHHGPDSREAITFPHIVFSAAGRGGYIRMAQIPGTPEMVSAGLLELSTAITPDCGIGSQQGLNPSCSPRRGLSNAMLHTQIGRQEEVDSRLLVVGSQIGSLIPDPSFAHNLGCRCPNCQCDGIFDIYVSRPFQ
jgi:hypothetical protein